MRQAGRGQSSPRRWEAVAMNGLRMSLTWQLRYLHHIFIIIIIIILGCHASLPSPGMSLTWQLRYLHQIFTIIIIIIILGCHASIPSPGVNLTWQLRYRLKSCCHPMSVVIIIGKRSTGNVRF